MDSKPKPNQTDAPAVTPVPETDPNNSEAENRADAPATETKSLFSTETRSNVSQKLLMKAAELADRKKREREAHPERMKYFLPRVYEYWEDDSALDEELKEQEKMMKEIKEKEEILKAKKDAGTFDSDDEELEEQLNEQKAVYHRLKTRKKREAAYLKRLEDELEREEQERALKEAERIHSELQNPSKYGWYYGDGYYNTAETLFGIREDLIEKFQDQQDKWREKWEKKHPETFTDKFKRHFWPPYLFFRGQLKLFRTRGTYLDFPEVIADPPRNIDVNFEKEEQAFLLNNLFIGEEVDENAITMADVIHEEIEVEGEVLKKEPEDGKRKSGGLSGLWKNKLKYARINTGWDQWYYDDDAGEFFPKREGFTGEYYMDGHNLCWRHKRPPRLNFKRQPTPYDWYYNVNAGRVVARADYLGFDEFEYDHALGVYKLKPIKYTKELKKLKAKSYRFGIFGQKPKVKKVNDDDEEPPRPLPKKPLKDFYFDEKFGCWLLKDDPNPEQASLGVEPSTSSIGANRDTEESAASSEVAEEPAIEIVWDENGHRFTRKWEGEWRGLTSLSPDDYYFDDDKGVFLPKPPRQGKEFKYHPEDGVWRKAKAPAPNKLKVQQKTIPTPSDYFFDSFQGQFLHKSVDKGARYDYWLQKYARIWRKHQEPKSGMYPEDFYWDSDRKLWLPRAIRMEMIKNAQSLKNRWAKEITGGAFKPTVNTPEDFFWDTEQGEFVLKNKLHNYYLDQDGLWKCEALKNQMMQRIFAHDFYFDHVHKEFHRKNKGQPYVFNATKNVWTVPGCPKDFVLNFYFDVESEKWLEGEYGKVGTLEQGFPVLSHSNSLFRIPDDYWFDEDYGRFQLKRIQDMPRYFFNASEGAWKKKGNLGPNRANLHPRNFYFDEKLGRFKLKPLKRPQDYWYDTNNKIYRYISSAGSTRTGCQPSDYHWNSELKQYMLSPIDKSRGNAPSQPTNWDPMRRYSKGWLPDNSPKENVTTPAAGANNPPPPTTPAAEETKRPSNKPKVEQNVPKKTTFAPQKK